MFTVHVADRQQTEKDAKTHKLLISKRGGC